MSSAKRTLTTLLAVAVVFLAWAGRAPAQGRWVRQYAARRAAQLSGWPFVPGGLYPFDPLAANGQIVGDGSFATGALVPGGNQENPLYAALRQQRQEGMMSVFRQHQYNPAPVVPPQPVYDWRAVWPPQPNPQPRPPATGK